jgi:3-deoxy-D-manno-octulosonate 8-phosphate phosphatase (KDO 8-P phosphatase)
MDANRTVEPTADVRERASRVKLVLLDVDGVLTDGRITLSADGEESKSFHVRDGHGIRMGQRGGLLFGFISGRESRVVRIRAEELYVTEVHQGVPDKLVPYDDIRGRLRLDDSAICFVGDDLVDAPVMRRAGFAAAPADAHTDVLALAHWVTPSAGGRGAVRDVVDVILRATGRWDDVTARHRK